MSFLPFLPTILASLLVGVLYKAGCTLFRVQVSDTARAAFRAYMGAPPPCMFNHLRPAWPSPAAPPPCCPLCSPKSRGNNINDTTNQRGAYASMFRACASSCRSARCLQQHHCPRHRHRLRWRCLGVLGSSRVPTVAAAVLEPPRHAHLE